MLPTRPFHIVTLQCEFERRVSKNKRYSIQSYAKSLQLHVTSLNRLLAGKQELSLASCPKVLKALDLSPEDQRAFLDSVLSERRRRESNALIDMIAACNLAPSPLETASKPKTFDTIATGDPSLVPGATVMITDFMARIAEHLGSGDKRERFRLSVNLTPATRTKLTVVKDN